MIGRPIPSLASAAALCACLGLTACRSPYIQTSIRNQSGSPVRLLEVDYPNASFGIQQIPNNTKFQYRFKVQDSGPVTLTFTGPDKKVHTSTGPTLTQGQQGTLLVILGQGDAVTWTPHLSPPK